MQSTGPVIQRAMFVPRQPVRLANGGSPAAGLASLAAPSAARGPAVEQFAAQQTAPLGQQVAQQTMAGIDAAQDPESLINALRGNARPLQERYSELAQLVGPQDAQATPASVLALVQPTLMLTQQGAVDSGIGELMQKLAGNISMEGPGGEPSPAAGGIGGLMAQGAGPSPEENFSPPPGVPGFQEGGPVGYDPREIDPTRYRSILRELQSGERADVEKELTQARDLAQSQALFDIAQGGLALAAGSPQGGSFAQQVGAAFAPVAASVGKRGAEFAAAERGIKKEARAEDLALRKLAAEMSKTPKRTLAEEEVALLSSPSLAAQYANNSLDPQTRARVEAILTGRAKDAQVVKMPVGGELVERRVLPLSDFWQSAIQQRASAGHPIPPILSAGVAFSGRTEAPVAGPTDPTAPPPAAAPTAAAQPSGQAPEPPPLFRLEQAFGVPAAVNRWIGTVTGTLDIESQSPESKLAFANAQNLAEQTLIAKLKAYSGRDSNQLRAQVGDMVPRPGRILGGVSDARAKVGALLNDLNTDIDLLQGNISAADNREAVRQIPGLETNRAKMQTALSDLIKIRDIWQKIYDGSRDPTESKGTVQSGRALLEQRQQSRN